MLPNCGQVVLSNDFRFIIIIIIPSGTRIFSESSFLLTINIIVVSSLTLSLSLSLSLSFIFVIYFLNDKRLPSADKITR